MKFLKKFFEIEENNSSFSKEALAGLSTFLASAYIIQVHPSIISLSGLDFNSCVASTVLICFFSSLTMSIYAKNPLVMAPGLGINSFFTFTMVIQMNIPVEKALGAVFWSGVIFLLLSLFEVRETIIKSVPDHLKKSLAAGMGLLIAFVGFQQGGLITHSEKTFVKQAPFGVENLIFIFSLFILFVLIARKIKGAFVLSILATSFLCFALSQATSLDLIQYKGIFSKPDFSLIGRLDLIGSLGWSLIPSIFSLAFVDLFESLGTFMGLLNRFKLTEKVNLKKTEKKERRLKESLIADALGTLYAGFLGSSSTTVFLESAVGLKEGGRTGFSALVSAFLFLPFLFLAPLISMIPQISSAPVLVMVGVFMIQPVQSIKWEKVEEAVPAFLTLTLTLLTFSITHGLIWGFLSFTFIKVCMGQAKSIPVFLYIISGFCIFFLVLMNAP